jgi:hypothetical protein
MTDASSMFQRREKLVARDRVSSAAKPIPLACVELIDALMNA